MNLHSHGLNDANINDSTIQYATGIQQNSSSSIRGRHSSNNHVTPVTNTVSLNQNRRKSLSYQHQMPFMGTPSSDEGTSCSMAQVAGRFSPHPNEIYLHQSGKLSIPPQLECYEDSLTCCIPPPSPAPNNDRYIVGVVTSQQIMDNNSQQQQQQQSIYQGQAQTHVLLSSNSVSSLSTGSANNQSPVTSITNNMNTMLPNKFTTSGTQRTLSPNTRYRLERYRETQQKPKHLESQLQSSCSSSVSNIPSTRYFLPSSAPLPLVPSETYTSYLSSTVHTPVKRYIPTPPLASDNFTDLTTTTKTMLATPTNCATSNTCLNSVQYTNTIPYGFRAKCCSNELQSICTTEMSNSLNKSTQVQCPPSGSSVAVSMPVIVSSACSPMGACKIRQGVQVASVPQQQQSSNIDTVHTLTRVNTSVSTTEIETNKGTSALSSGTCLHCNTARRTTGVHQTTQTTGPISPVPVSQQFVSNNANGNIYYASSVVHEHSLTALTPSTAESHISPTSPTVQMQQQQQLPPQNHYHKHSSENNVAFSHYHQQQSTLPQQQKNNHMIVPAASPRIQQQITNTGQHLHHHPQITQQQQLAQTQSQQQQRHYSRKKRLSQYVRKRIARFFGVEPTTESEDLVLWLGRHRRLALRRFGAFHVDHNPMHANTSRHANLEPGDQYQQQQADRPDILPAHDEQLSADLGTTIGRNTQESSYPKLNSYRTGDYIERKASVANMFLSSLIYVAHAFNQRSSMNYSQRQWSRSFAPIHMRNVNDVNADISIGSDVCENAAVLIEEEVFFDSGGEAVVNPSGNSIGFQSVDVENNIQSQYNRSLGGNGGTNSGVGVYMSERHHGWRTTALNGVKSENLLNSQDVGRLNSSQQANVIQMSAGQNQMSARNVGGLRGNRISAQLLDGVLENSRRPQAQNIKYFSVNDIDDRTDHRPFFTYWINTVQITVLFLSILCYGFAPIGFGSEQKTGQVLVTSLSLQTVQHTEQRNFWIGPRNNELVHIGAKFATCMRKDVKIIDVLMKTRRQERDTACCIRNDDSGCVQSSQADCSVRGLFPTKTISTWKKWSPGESGPGGRISGSVCGLDPKFCDAPASIAPYEWPDDITKWPICRKTNSFSSRFRYKDHTAEHMVCEVIGHPCCTGVYGECRITTREYCDFVNGYFHEEASLCSQISCLNNVCGMFPFFLIEAPDQFYRLLTSLCMHAGILHLAITVIFQHIFLADLERLIGPIRTAVVYIGSGLAGNLTSAVLVPYKPEVGPSASLCGVLASLIALLILMHWKQLQKPHVALFKLVLLSAVFFGIGTLPYQLNFAGLLAGSVCGIFLTISLVPFVSISKYDRKAKINFIWSCVIFHLLFYVTMTIIFYVFPMEFTNLNFSEGLNHNFNSIITTSSSFGGSDAFSNSRTASSSYRFSQTQKPQFYYHHHSDDIIRNSAALTVNSKIAHLLEKEETEKEAHLYFIHSTVHYATNTNNNNSLSSEEIRKHVGNKFQYQLRDYDPKIVHSTPNPGYYNVLKSQYKAGINQVSNKTNESNNLASSSVLVSKIGEHYNNNSSGSEEEFNKLNTDELKRSQKIAETG